MITPIKHPPVYRLDTECPICGRMYSAQERVDIGGDPNACSRWCLDALPVSVRYGPFPWASDKTIS
jgi:hypothetical protein